MFTPLVYGEKERCVFYLNSTELMSEKNDQNVSLNGNLQAHIASSVKLRCQILVAFLGLALFVKFFLKVNLSTLITFIILFWLLSTTFLLPWLVSRSSAKLRYYGHFGFFLLEVFMLSAIVYLLGGVNWVGPLAFVFTIVYVNFLLKRVEASIVVVEIMVVLALMVLAEYFRLIPAQRLFGPAADSSNFSFAVTTLSFLVVFFIVLNYTVGRFAALLNERTIEAQKATKNLVETNRRLIESEKRLAGLNEDLETIISAKTTELAERNVELEILNAVALSLGKSLKLDSILCDTLNQVVKIFPISRGEISLLDDPEANIAYVVRNNAISKLLHGPSANRLSQKFIPEVVKVRKPIVVDVGISKPRSRLIDDNIGSVNNLAIFPIKTKSQIVGTLAVTSAKGNYLMAKDIRLISSISNMIGSAIENGRLYHRIKKLSDTDSITGLFNHRFITRRLESEFKRAVRYRHCLSAMMIDVDNLKTINDKYGHLMGDQALRQVSLALMSACRTTDVIGRYGGDEFLIILPETSTSQGFSVAKRILRQVSQLELRESGMGANIIVKPTVSIGVSTYPGSSRSLWDLITAADDNLYVAKKAGGDRVVAGKHVEKAPKVIDDGHAQPLGA